MRRSPLRRSKGLASGAQLASSGINPKSKSKRKKNSDKAMAAVRPLLVQRAGEICEYCGDQRGEHAHHRQKRSTAEGDVLSNLVWVCNLCHLVRIHAHPDDAMKLGFIVATWAEPGLVPVRYRGEKFVYLCDDGSILDPSSYE